MSDGSADGLSGILNQLANGEKQSADQSSHSSKKSSKAKIDPDDQGVHMQHVNGHEDEELIVAEIEDEGVASVPSTPRRTTPARRPTKRKQNTGLKTVAVPLLAVVAVLCLIPAIWGTMILGGSDVAGSQKDGAKAMAIMMMACWPIALALLGGAVFYHFELRKHKRQAASQKTAGRSRR